MQRQRLGDLDELLLADAQRAHQRGRRRAEVQRLEQLGGGLQLSATVDEEGASDQLRAEKDVVGHGHARHQVELLVDDRHAVPGRVTGALKPHRQPVDRDLAIVVGVDPAGDLHQRRLAGAVLTHQRVDLAGARGEIDALEHRHVAERFADAAHGEQRWSSCVAHSGRRASPDPRHAGPAITACTSALMRDPGFTARAPLARALARPTAVGRCRAAGPLALIAWAARTTCEARGRPIAPAISRARIP